MPPSLVVCVPARDERAMMPRLLACLAAQRGAPPFGVLLLANNCRDGTAAAARQAAAALPDLRLRILEQEFPPGLAHAGSARRAAMAAGAAWLREAEAGAGLLVSTDADAAPPPGWLAAIAGAVAAGADCVGGRILAEDTEENPLPPPIRRMNQRIQRYWSAVRAVSDAIDPVAHDPAPRHGDHVGASLAVTLAVFAAVGGVPPLPSGEDLALVAAIEAAGGRVRHDPAVWLPVSARRQGRAEAGMAAEMQRWLTAEAQGPYLLPAAGFWAAQARQRRQIRQAHGGDPAALAQALGLQALEAAAAASGNDIAFVARVTALLPRAAPPQQEITAATLALEAMLA
ncbi:glycosyltransferase family 2 protein [Roseomonas sp. 18066]|uniref:glycosyltransferase n=1 Tax=Roseomonas sp. 18066 TaxID=2681412 RepID=UPI00135CCD79|nr:glycosyltransferase [Roseomonas sp. 18066]